MSPDEGCSGDLGRRAPRQLSGEQRYPRASARRCRDQRSRALEAGASAFVAKTAPVQDVIVAIRHAAVAPSSFTASGLAEAVSRRRVVRARLALSPREIEVLRLMRDGKSVPAISMAMFISQSTAKTYIARLSGKLGAANRTQALMKAIQYGLIDFNGTLPAEATVARASR